MRVRPARLGPAVTEDVLSDVLRAVRLTGAVFFDYELTSPWVAEAPPSNAIRAAVMPGADRVIEYHLLARGACWARAGGIEPIRLVEGDLLLFPQGDPHTLASAPGLHATPDLGMFVRSSAPLPIVHAAGGGGPDGARVICGFLGCDERPFNPLLEALPRVLHVPAAVAQDGLISTLFLTAARESGRLEPGGENVLARVSELLFVEVVRRHLRLLSDAETGWFAGLRDPLVGRALAAIHSPPAEAWSVESLARRAGSSRSVLAERFTAIVGQSPMQYLTRWRMQLASRRLRDGATIAEAASGSGYDSEAAFSRALKKVVGESPGAWRRTAPA
jgi:AraC-like DNA-binding protein